MMEELSADKQANRRQINEKLKGSIKENKRTAKAINTQNITSTLLNSLS